jgi:opacity protein-like surface antigen
VNFWSFIGDRVIGTVSVGNQWYRLGSQVATDTAIVDLSDLSMTAAPLLGGIGYVFGDDDIHPYVILHGGATFVTINLGPNRPSEEINNEAYFTLGATAGLGYSVSGRVTISTSARYLKMFDEDLQSLSVLFGASFLL